jgi:DnaJ like chaperone protein
MIWQGKALGALVGVLAAGPAGALFGAFVGHLFDTQGDSLLRRIGLGGKMSLQEAYFRAVFQVMGCIAKADGRVTEQDIHAARAMMSQFRLGEAETRLAQELFREGKRSSFPLEKTLAELHRLCGERTDLCRMFVQIQVQTALWGAGLDAPGREVLTRVCALLGVSAYDMVQMEAMLRMQGSGRAAHVQDAAEMVIEAYAVLGVERTASDAEVTRAYRRLTSQNHPDKLHAKGLPEAMMRLAAEKTRQIREAYETVCTARGLR